MSASFYFYDLETTGIKPAYDRIMQFGGQRTDMSLKPIGKPHNIFIKLTQDVLPDPYAILVTGITPQFTQQNGITEAEFIRIFYEEISVEGTIFVGYNNIRFDDEFMRFTCYRNFYDAYEWHWKDGRSRWDLLDVVRMTRALRPAGIKWPVDSSGKPSNKLELITRVNNLAHDNAHDALADVNAVIDVAKLINKRQPKLFSYLLELRKKDKIAELLNSGQPFIYSSGKYPSEFEKTTAAVKLADHPKKQGALVYDLRQNPDDFINLKAEEIAKAWTWRPALPEGKTQTRFPVKTLQYNRCPAVAPLAVLDDDSKTRLKLDIKIINENFKKLKNAKNFIANLKKALEILDKRQQERLFSESRGVDGQLYDSFFSDQDRNLMLTLQKADPNNLSNFTSRLKDQRLKALLPLYKARNFPASLSESERRDWEKYVHQSLTDDSRGLKWFFARLDEIKLQGLARNKDQQYTLEELRLYGESLLPY